MFLRILFLAFCLIQVRANEELEADFQRNLDVKELELLNKLLSPNDTTLQQETKTLLAHALAEAEKKRLEAAGGGIGTNTPDVVVGQEKIRTSTASPVTMTTPTTSTTPTRTESSEASTTTASTSSQRPTPSTDHVLSQVNKILQNVASGNVVGIVDESLAIRAPNPVRNLVNGILTTIFCNPIDRLFNRCQQSASSPNRIG